MACAEGTCYACDTVRQDNKLRKESAVQDYVLKDQSRVKVVRIGASNGQEIRNFIGTLNTETTEAPGGGRRAMRVYASLGTYNNWITTPIGHWLVKEPGDVYKVYSNAAFEAKYKPADTVTLKFFDEATPKKKPANDGLKNIRTLQGTIRSLRNRLQAFADEKEGDLYALQDRAAWELEQDGETKPYTSVAVKQVSADKDTITGLISLVGGMNERTRNLVPALRD